MEMFEEASLLVSTRTSWMALVSEQGLVTHIDAIRGDDSGAVYCLVDGRCYPVHNASGHCEGGIGNRAFLETPLLE